MKWKESGKIRIKWNFELTVFELTVPDLYLQTKPFLPVISDMPVDQLEYILMVKWQWKNSSYKNR